MAPSSVSYIAGWSRTEPDVLATAAMDVWLVDKWDGEPANLDPTEHDALAWLNHFEMAALRLADPRLPGLFEAALH